MANTFAGTASSSVYKEEWATKVQERLNKPTNWKEVCDVVYSDSRVIHFPYLSTDVSETSLSRGTGYSFANFAATDSALSITTARIAAEKIDRADLAQLSFNGQMEIADRQGLVLNERIETAVLANHANWTDVGDPGTGIASGDTTQITVSASNIDDIVRGVRRIINVANGQDLAMRNGIFFVWRSADYEYLEQFAQAEKIIGLLKSFLIGLNTLWQGATRGKQELMLCAA